MTLHQCPTKVMLDSGAFSSWSKEETIDLDAYIDFIKRNKHLLHSYVNLDVIPGRLGVPRTNDEVEFSAKQSYANLKKMKRAGLSPIPVFHQGEEFSWLERMLRDGEPYIGISPADDTADNDQKNWLDLCFTHLTDSSGCPLVRTHGFGVTSIIFLLRYPFATCDSTTWVLSPGYGRVFVPKLKPSDGSPDFLNTPIVAKVTDIDPRSKQKNPLQFENLDKDNQNAVIAWADHCSVSMAELRYNTHARRRLMLMFYRRLEIELGHVRFGHRGYGFVFKPFTDLPSMPPIRDLRLQIVAATNTDYTRSKILNEMQVEHRLLSYYLLRDCEEHLEPYVTTGVVNQDYKLRVPTQNWLSAYRNYRALELHKHMARLSDDDESEGTIIEAGEGGAGISASRSDTNPGAFLVRGRSTSRVQRQDSHSPAARNRVPRRRPRASFDLTTEGDKS